MNYEAIKEHAKETGQRVSDLVALTLMNDPFYCGCAPSQKRTAEWFAELWQRFGFPRGTHLRRVHYQLVSQKTPVKLPDGSPYENTEKCWADLMNAGKWARYRGLVRYDAFVDKRNPETKRHAYYGVPDSPSWEVNRYSWLLPSIPSMLSVLMPEIEVTGYEYDLADQPYHLELWAEKSTMDDILDPICIRLGMNLETAQGEMSITKVRNLVSRVQTAGKPARIFYVSDFDPAGWGMPVAVARKIEYLVRDREGLDIRLQPIVLTRGQVQHFRLPRKPIKDSDGKKAKFEEVHGAGAVELDALEALHPGELGRIIEEAAAPFRDTELGGELASQQREMQEKAERELAEKVAPYANEVEEIRGAVEGILEKYSGMNEELEPFKIRLREIYERMEEDTEDLEIDLADRCEAQCPTDGTDWLYDSRRDYFEQLAYYKERKNGHKSQPGAEGGGE